MREYQAMMEPSESWLGHRVTECDSWEDLAALVQEAEEIYMHQANIVRRLSRTIGDYAIALKAWANLLPTDNNMSIMSGGVKLLLGVSKMADRNHLSLLTYPGHRSTKCTARKSVDSSKKVS